MKLHKEIFMKKTSKILFVTFLLSIVLALTSCADLLEAVGGAMTQAAGLKDQTFTAKVSGKNISMTFIFEDIPGTDVYQLNLTVDGRNCTGYGWQLDTNDLEGTRDVFIYKNPSNHTDPILGRLTPNALLPTALTPYSSFTLEGANVTTTDVFRSN